MAWVNKYLSEQEIQEIEKAIDKAEQLTSGEIVPVIVKKSSSTGHVPLMLTLIITLMIVIAEFPYSDWLWVTPWVYVWPFLLLIIFAVSLALARIPWVQKVLVPEADELRQVHQRAQLEFYANKIYRTEQGTGILLFISVMEKKAVILADEGISQRLPPGTWDELLGGLGRHLGKGTWGPGFVQAIEQCGELLKTQFPIDPSSKNELKNHLIVKE